MMAEAVLVVPVLAGLLKYTVSELVLAFVDAGYSAERSPASVLYIWLLTCPVFMVQT
jgi:hypothetical protein